MSIPIAHTTITVWGLRPLEQYDPDAVGYDYEPLVPNAIAQEIRASISMPSGKRSGETEEDEWVLRCDLLPEHLNGLSRYDTVIDDRTGVEYEVTWVAESTNRSVGLEHIKAKLRIRKGLPIGGGNTNAVA